MAISRAPGYCKSCSVSLCIRIYNVVSLEKLSSENAGLAIMLSSLRRAKANVTFWRFSFTRRSDFAHQKRKLRKKVYIYVSTHCSASLKPHPIYIKVDGYTCTISRARPLICNIKVCVCMYLSRANWFPLFSNADVQLLLINLKKKECCLRPSRSTCSQQVIYIYPIYRQAFKTALLLLFINILYYDIYRVCCCPRCPLTTKVIGETHNFLEIDFFFKTPAIIMIEQFALLIYKIYEELSNAFKTMLHLLFFFTIICRDGYCGIRQRQQ